jgi:hypothetical protein
MTEQGSHDIVTVVLTADNHLGYSAFGQHPRKREERLQRLRRAFQQATDFAVGQGVDLFIQAGDLFDMPNPTEQDRSFVAARLAELRQAGIRTFALSGTHDTPTDPGSYPGDEDYMAELDSAMFPGLAPQVSYARLGALHYFPPLPTPQHSIPVELEPVMIDVHGVLLALCGLSVLAGHEGDPLAKVHVQSDIERAAISLLILHAPIEGLPSQKNVIHAGAFAPVARSTIGGQSSFRTILAGYHHAYQHMHIGHTDVIVAGATQHIDFSDPDDEPGFVFLGLAADGIRWCHHIPGDTLRLRRLVIHTSELWGNVTDDPGTTSHVPTDTILERLRPLCTTDSMVQLQLLGELSRDQYHQLDLGQVRGYGEEHCFELAIDERGLSLLPIDSSLAPKSSALSFNGHSVPAVSDEVGVGTNPSLQRGFASTAAASGGRGRPQPAAMIGERLSPREELVHLADEWIAVADDEQEKKALIATKEELLTALDRMKTRR